MSNPEFPRESARRLSLHSKVRGELRYKMNHVELAVSILELGIRCGDRCQPACRLSSSPFGRLKWGAVLYVCRNSLGEWKLRIYGHLIDTSVVDLRFGFKEFDEVNHRVALTNLRDCLFAP